MLKRDFLVFSFSESADFSRKVAESLGKPLTELEELKFSDSEFKINPSVDVENKNIYLIQSLYHDSEVSLSSKLCRTFFFISTLKGAGARQITMLSPYLAYSRQDRKERNEEAMGNQHLAILLEACGVKKIVTFDVHNISAFQNAYRCQTLNLEADRLFVDYFAQHLKEKQITIVSPDSGGIKRAKKFKGVLESRGFQQSNFALIDKMRVDGKLAVQRLFGSVNQSIAILYDDMISTGETIFKAARLCKENGARKVIAVATHGLFFEKALDLFSQSEIDEVLITDTVNAPRRLIEHQLDKVKVVSVVEMIAEVIRKQEQGWFSLGI